MTQTDLFGDPVRQTPPFYNTSHLTGADLTQAKRAAMTQEELILAFFKARAGQLLTPEDALKALSPRTPITSARRAISNLTLEGHLIKTERMRAGRHGKPIHYWMVR